MLVQGSLEPEDVRRAHERARRAEELGLGAVGDDPPLADHDDVVGDDLDLVEQVRGEQHRAAVVGIAAQQVAHPADAGRVEPVRRLVEDEHGGLADEGCGDTEALTHSERVVADSLGGLGLGEPDRLDGLVHAAGRQAHEPLCEREDLATGASGVLGRGVEHDAHLDARVG